MLILFTILQWPPFAAAPSGSIFCSNPASQPPPGTPILQDNPRETRSPDNNPRKGIDNIREFRHDEEVRMNEYATQDGNIHIPIERAMEDCRQESREAQRTGDHADTGSRTTSRRR